LLPGKTNAAHFSYHDKIIEDDGMEPMGDGHYSAIMKLGPDHVLNQSVGVRVYIGGS